MLTIERIIATDVICVAATLSFSQGVELLLHSNVPDLFVVDHNGNLQGILPDYVILRCQLAEDCKLLKVGERCLPVNVSLTPKTTLVEAAALLKLNVHARLPVVAAGRLLGIVTRQAVLQSLYFEHHKSDAPQDDLQEIPRPQFLNFPTATELNKQHLNSARGGY